MEKSDLKNKAKREMLQHLRKMAMNMMAENLDHEDDTADVAVAVSKKKEIPADEQADHEMAESDGSEHAMIDDEPSEIRDEQQHAEDPTAMRAKIEELQAKIAKLSKSSK